MKKRFIVLGAVLLTAGLTISSIALPKLTNAASSTITVSKFDSMLKDVVGESVITEEDAFSKKATLTQEKAALLLDRADESLNPKKFDEDMCKRVKDYKRISDLAKADKAFRDPIVRCFTKGLMIGKSNGTYSQSRKLSPKAKVSSSEAKTYVSRLKTKTKRIKVTWDGQVTRTKNLPKNYKKYPYILASFPNSYYEGKFAYDYCISPMVSGKDYKSPKQLYNGDYIDGYKFSTIRNRNWENWRSRIYTNLHHRLNYNYNCSNKTFNKWCSELAASYNDSGSSDNHAAIVKRIKSYRKWASSLGTHVKSSKIVIEPSSAHEFRGIVWVRCYIEFKAKATKRFPTASSGDQNGLIQGYEVYFPGLKNNKTYKCCVNIPLSGYPGGTVGSHDKIDPLEALTKDSK